MNVAYREEGGRVQLLHDRFQLRFLQTRNDDEDDALELAGETALAVQISDANGQGVGDVEGLGRMRGIGDRHRVVQDAIRRH